MMDFEGKNAVVTGAARGIGRSIAEALAAKGAHVAVVDLMLDEASATAAELTHEGASVRAYSCDVSSHDETIATGKRIQEEMGDVALLINNAGIVRDRLLLRMKPEDWNAVLQVNLTGVYNVTKAFAPRMLKMREGRIVNIASVIGLIGNAGQANYAASKAGIIGLTKSLAREFAPRGVTVNAVAPGFIETTMTESLSEDVRNRMIETIPMGRFGRTTDVADVVMFLLSNAAAYVTGQVLNCDGGMVMAG